MKFDNYQHWFHENIFLITVMYCNNIDIILHHYNYRRISAKVIPFIVYSIYLNIEKCRWMTLSTLMIWIKHYVYYTMTHRIQWMDAIQHAIVYSYNNSIRWFQMQTEIITASITIFQMNVVAQHFTRFKTSHSMAQLCMQLNTNLWIMI